MKLNSSLFVLLWLVLWLTGTLQINQLQECETLIHSFFQIIISVFVLMC